MDEVGLSFGSEVPLHRGGAVHLAALLTGDAAQFEALSRHRLGVRVHFCTGAMATVRCPTGEHNQNRRQSPRRGASNTEVDRTAVQHHVRPSLGLQRRPHCCYYTFITEEEESQLTKEGAEQRQEQQLHPHRSSGTFYASKTTKFKAPVSSKIRPNQASREKCVIACL